MKSWSSWKRRRATKTRPCSPCSAAACHPPRWVRGTAGPAGQNTLVGGARRRRRFLGASRDVLVGHSSDLCSVQAPSESTRSHFGALHTVLAFPRGLARCEWSLALQVGCSSLPRHLRWARGGKQPKQFPRLLLRPLGRSCWGQESQEGSGFQGAAQAGCRTHGGDRGLGAVPVPAPCARPRVPACVMHISAAEAVFLPALSACCCEAVPIRLAVGCSSPRLLPAFDKPPAPLAPQ